MARDRNERPGAALTDKERRRLHESIESDDPMVLAEAEDAMADALAAMELDQ